MIWIFCIFFLFAEESFIEDLPADALDKGSAVESVQNEPLSLVKRLTVPFEYFGEDKRDPFILPEAKEAPLLPGPYFGPFLPMQEYALQDVVVKGIILDPVRPKALLQVKQGSDTKLIRVTVGEYLGENFGMIQAIRDGKVIVVQTLGEGDKKSTSTITLSIRK